MGKLGDASHLERILYSKLDLQRSSTLDNELDKVYRHCVDRADRKGLDRGVRARTRLNGLTQKNCWEVLDD